MDSNHRHPASETGVATAELPRNVPFTFSVRHAPANAKRKHNQCVGQESNLHSDAGGLQPLGLADAQPTRRFGEEWANSSPKLKGCPGGLEPPCVQDHSLAPRPLRDRTPSNSVPWVGFEPTVSWLRTRRPLQAGTARAFFRSGPGGIRTHSIPRSE